jgi:hypothetical protein
VNPVAGLGIRLLIWLPICFGAWYFTSILFVLPLAWSLDGITAFLVPDLVSGVRAAGNELVVQTRLEVSRSNAVGTSVGEILFVTNPLKYGYSIPLYTALVLAAPASDVRKPMAWVIGMLALTLAQVFGVGTEILKTLAFGVGEEGRLRLGWSSGELEALAVLYQLGYLILPPVVPIVIWMWQFRGVLAPITGWAEARPGTARDDIRPRP